MLTASLAGGVVLPVRLRFGSSVICHLLREQFCELTVGGPSGGTGHGAEPGQAQGSGRWLWLRVMRKLPCPAVLWDAGVSGSLSPALAWGLHGSVSLRFRKGVAACVKGTDLAGWPRSEVLF